MNEITKLHKRDTTSSYDEFLRYAQSYKLILTTSTTHPVNNETPNLYSEGATLSNFIHEGRPTTTKLTLVDLPSSTDHSTLRECSKGILYLPPTSNSLIKSTQKLLVRASMSTSKSSTLIRRQIPTFLHHSLTTNQVTSSYETYTTTLTTQTTSAIIKIKTDKSLQFQANWLNIARVTNTTT